MEEYLPLLQTTALFAGFDEAELKTLLPLLAPALRSYQKGEALLTAGQNSDEIGVLLAGQAEAVKYTRAGGKFILSRFEPGRVFGDVLSGGHAKSPVTVRATAPVTALMIPGRRLFSPPGRAQGLFNRLLANLVGVLSDKYFALDRRLDFLLIHGLRRRLAAFLLDAGGEAGAAGQVFTIPFDRAQLAGYLGCERSALSREISALVKAGLVETRRSAFRIPSVDALKALF